MRTLENLFSRYGSPSSEMNETKHFYFTRADHIESIEHVQSEDKKAVNTINELLEFAKIFKRSHIINSFCCKRLKQPPAIVFYFALP